MNDRGRRKVFGIGWHKTGTTTLGVCMSRLGWRNRSWVPEDFEAWLRGDVEVLLETATQYESFDDFPWSFLIQELDERFPGSQFVLTLRKDSDAWFQSMCKHASRTGPVDFREHIYGFSMPHEHRGVYVSAYEAHNDAVRSYFGSRPDQLLEVCWEEGDGWSSVCRFVGVEPPDEPFPHVNKSP